MNTYKQDSFLPLTSVAWSTHWIMTWSFNGKNDLSEILDSSEKNPNAFQQGRSCCFVFFFKKNVHSFWMQTKKISYGTGPQQISSSISQNSSLISHKLISLHNSGIILFSVPESSRIHCKVHIHGKFNSGSLSCLYRFFSKEINKPFAGQKKPQSPLWIPNPETFYWAAYVILGHGSSFRVFLHVLSIRLQSLVIPAEGNIIKPFIKGFSRQLLYKAPPACLRFCCCCGLGSSRQMF